MKNVFRLSSYPISLAATKDTFGGSEYSGWSFPVSFMLILITLSLHRNLSFFVEFFQHIFYGWIVMLFMLSDTFYIIHLAVYIVHKSRSYRGKGSNRTYLHLYFYAFLATKNALRS